jgi:hypothetical protein
MKPYLIQRCSVKKEKGTREDIVFGNFVDFDYMGSAEFEFGALGRMLQVFLKEKDQLKIYNYKHKFLREKHGWFVVTTDALWQEVEQWINNHIDGKQKDRTKEICLINDRVSNNKESINFWVDIQNPWFLSPDKAACINILNSIKNFKEGEQE